MTYESLHYDSETTDITVNQEGSEYLWLQNGLPIPSLISSPSWCCRWTCDCRLRSFRLWLTQSNVPRMVEPSCQGPRRLVGIHIQSLSLAEFACAPQLSPTSMYLTVPKGKNVSIVCRVASDPVSTITWYFNGQKIHSSDNENSNMVSKMSLFQL